MYMYIDMSITFIFFFFLFPFFWNKSISNGKKNPQTHTRRDMPDIYIGKEESGKRKEVGEGGEGLNVIYRIVK